MPERTTPYLLRGPTSNDPSSFPEAGPQKEASLAYNTKLDVQAYRALLGLRWHLTTAQFEEELNSLNQLTRINVETSIGDRFNVELFQTVYYIEENLIIHPLYKEPFIKIVKRGQKFRQEKGSTDIERELAEVEGFEKIQAVLADPDTSDAKVISISPKGKSGSIYQHNFFDVYEKNPDGTITMSRYTSKLSWNEFYQAAQVLDSFNNIPNSPKDADFLKQPLITYKSIKEVLEIMHPQEETMSQQQYQQLLKACTPLILIYMRNLAERDYNAILKFADVYTGFDRQITSQHQRNYIVQSIQKPELVQKTAMFLAAQEIRQVATACGLSGSSSSSLYKPFSVSEFATTSSAFEDEYGTLEIHCEECGMTYLRNPHKLEEQCRYCGGTKGIAC